MTFVDENVALPTWFQDLTGQGIVVTDLGLVIRSWSRWMEMHSGYRADQVIGHPLDDVYPELTARHLDRYFELALSGQVTVLAQRLHRYLLPMPSPDPAFDYMQQSARIGPLLDGNRVAGTVVVIDDVTERASHERELRQLLAQEQAARATAEATQARMALLAEVSAILAASLDSTVGLNHAARRLLPLLGDYCIIDTITSDAAMHRVATVHIDPAKETLLQALAQRYPTTLADHFPGRQVLQTGEIEILAEVVPVPAIYRDRDDTYQDLLHVLATRSVLTAPLVAREQTIGLLTLCSTQANYYSDKDRELAGDLARRIALAIDSGHLYRETQAALQARDHALAVAENERAKLYRLFTQAPAAICTLQGPEHQFTFANLLYRQLFGNRVLVGGKMREALPEAAEQGFIALLDRVYRTGEPFFGDEVPLTLAKDDGVIDTRFLNFVYQATRDADGVIDGILVHAVDVTEQVRAQQEREALLATIHEQRERLRVTLSSIGDAVIVTDEQGNITFMNRVAEMLTSWRQADAIAQPIELIFTVFNEENGERTKHPVQRAIKQDTIVGVRGPMVLVTRDGTGIPIDDSVAPIRDDLGRIIGVVLVFRDISERRRAEQERTELLERTEAAREEAEAAVRMRDVFFSVAAHELKTPLTSLLGNVQLIQRRGEREHVLQEREQRNFDVVVSQGRRLQQMIEALLDVTRIESGQLSLDQAPLALDDLLRRIVVEIQPTLTRHTLVFNRPRHALMIDGDALRLEQVFQNLIQNAVKYSPDGGTITVTTAQHGTDACMSVADQGIGIPQASLPQVFQRFHRAANVAGARQISGMGIGLYVVKEIITLHGGTVAVVSTEDVGSTFTVCLPLLM